MRSALRACAPLVPALAACTPPAPATGPAPEPEVPRVERPAPLAYTPLSEGLPPIPRVDGGVEIRVVQPAAGSTRPRVDSTAVYGSVGSGGAGLLVNGTPVAVAPNGAFLGYLPVPADGVWRFEAYRGDAVDTEVVTQRLPSGGTAGRAGSETFAAPLALTVRGGDTLATGSDAVYARPSPTGTYRWFFPAGARLSAVERSGSQYRVRLDSATSAWIDTAAVAAAGGTPAGSLGRVEVAGAARWVDVRIAAGFRPFRVEPGNDGWQVTVYGATRAPLARTLTDSLVREVTVRASGGSSLVGLRFARRPWGYKAFYEPDGTLVLRLRRPPAIDPAAPLRGRRIVIDPGHPPAGATGPTGLREADANLAISLPLAELLRAAGAEVVLTRDAAQEVSLAERVRMAVAADGDLLVSVHNNAFGDGQNPFRAFHTTVYHFHPFSADLAASLDREIAGVTRIRDLGARAENLALVRPTWLPSALTESLFMPIPEQESALRDSAFVRRLAEAHARGIEAFLRERAGP